MKYLVKEDRCVIMLEGRIDDKAIETSLRALALVVSGVDENGHWNLFNALMQQVNDRLIQECFK